MFRFACDNRSNWPLAAGAAGDAAVYPSMAVSRKLIWGNLWFAFKNYDFSLLMAAIYFLIGAVFGLRDTMGCVHHCRIRARFWHRILHH